MKTHILLTTVTGYATLYPIATTEFYGDDKDRAWARPFGKTDGEPLIEPFDKIISALNPIQLHYGPDKVK